MKKITFLLLLCALAISSFAFAQNTLSSSEDERGTTIINGPAGTATQMQNNNARRMPITITHNSSQTIEFGIACASPTIIVDNTIWSDYDLDDDFGITADFDVTAVEIAIEGTGSIAVPVPITVNIYSTDGAFPGGITSQVLQGTTAYMVQSADLNSVISIPISATIPFGDNLLYEIDVLDHTPNAGAFRFGVNNVGATAPSWLVSITCGVLVPTTLETLGFPGSYVMNVIGSSCTLAITCPADVDVNTDLDTCEALASGVALGTPTTNGCPGEVISNDAPLNFPLGDTMVTWTVTDAGGSTSCATQIVTVTDDEQPVISCSTHITVDTDPGVCTANVAYTVPTATDNCGVASVLQTIGVPPGSDFPIGTSTIEYTATDINGNISTCSFTINVNDNEDPVAVCQNITIQLDASGNASITSGDLDGGSSDNCGIASIVISNDTFDCSNVGLNGVTFLVTDDSGNTADCVAFVTVEDNTAPNAVCQDITVSLDASGMASINAADVDGGSSDACGLDANSISIDIDTFDCSNLGANTVTLTVTDDEGNSSSCTATVTVEDVTAPTALCSNFTVALDAAGTASITAADIDNGSSDDCTAVTLSVSPSSFDCDDIGANTVTLTVTDADGNSSSCTATVTVEDNIDPVFDSSTLPANQERMADANGNYTLEDFTTGVTVTDNCSITEAVIIIGQDPAVGTVLTIGTYDVTLTATDDLGNDVEHVFELKITAFLAVGDNTNLSSLAMYPNPASDYLVISNPQSIELKQVSIYDLMGRLIQTIDLSSMGTEKTIDVSNLSSATYLVLIQGTNSQIAKQLIKE